MNLFEKLLLFVASLSVSTFELNVGLLQEDHYRLKKGNTFVGLPQEDPFLSSGNISIIYVRYPCVGHSTESLS